MSDTWQQARDEEIDAGSAKQTAEQGKPPRPKRKKAQFRTFDYVDDSRQPEDGSLVGLRNVSHDF